MLLIGCQPCTRNLTMRGSSVQCCVSLFVILTLNGLATGADLPEVRLFEQQQDHFDGSNDNTWLQNYYVNDTFWTPGSDAPIFLCVGGEGPAFDGSVVVDSVHCSNAVSWLPEVKGLMLAVQHRYYGCNNGATCPVSDFSSPTAFEYLSSRQALADLATFHAHATEVFGLTGRNKWVTWGGSYPGMLAGWMRLKFPHLIYAAVASSAPVNAQLDMIAYNDVVAEAFGATSVGGSPACVEAIASSHVRIGNMMNGTLDERELLATMFGLDDDAVDTMTTVAFQKEFSGNGVVEFDAQSNDPACTEDYCNIEKMCAAILDQSVSSDPLERLAVIYRATNAQPAVRATKELVRHKRGGSRRTVQFGGAVDSSSSSGGVVQDPTNDDFWNYQTCAEFGFYQTCEPGSKCMFTQGLIDVYYDDFLPMCRDQYGISEDTVTANIHDTNQYYGGEAPAGSRVMWVNGQVDPWKSRSILNSDFPEDQPTLYVEGASHHFWTHFPKDTDSDQIVEARAAIRNQVKEWLDLEEDPVTFPQMVLGLLSKLTSW